MIIMSLGLTKLTRKIKLNNMKFNKTRGHFSRKDMKSSKKTKKIQDSDGI